MATVFSNSESGLAQGPGTADTHSVTEPAAPRIDPLPKESWNDDALAALRSAYGEETLARFFSTGPDALPTPNVLGTLLYHPALAGPWLTYNNVLLRTPDARSTAQRELMVLRVAWRTRSTYEWVQHVKLGERYGDRRATTSTRSPTAPHARQLDAARTRPRRGGRSAVDRTVIDDDTWARLGEHLDERQLVEVVFVVGTYTCLAMAFNSFGLELDTELDTARSRCPE